MRYLITQLPFFLLMSIVLSACGQTETNKVIGPEEFSQKLNKTDNAQLIDVRTPEEYEEEHLEDAKNIDFYEPDFEAQIEQLDKSQPVFLYCGSGGRSGQAASMLKEAGFKEVHDLEGGIIQWKEEGKKVVKE